MLSFSQLPKLSRNKQTLLRNLNRKRNRYKEQCYLVEGERAVSQLLLSQPQHIRFLVLEPKAIDSLKRISLNMNIYQVAEGALSEFADTDQPQGVMAVAELPEAEPVKNLAANSGPLVVFDRIRDPGNLGTMIRSALWFGAAGMLVSDGTVDPFHPKVVRSCAGSSGLLGWAHGDLKQMLDEAEEAGRKAVLLDMNSEAHPPDKLREQITVDEVALVIGNEAHGIDKQAHAANRSYCYIPGTADAKSVESLNASIALAIALFHFRG